MKNLHLGKSEITIGLITVKNPERVMITTDTNDEGTCYYSDKDYMFLGNKIKNTITIEDGYFNIDDFLVDKSN